MTPKEVMQAVLDRLWKTYCQQVPYAEKYRQLVNEKGGVEANDHLAFRSFNTSLPMQPTGYLATERIFTSLGYERATEYDFPQMNLKAIHLEHEDILMPRIFISQLEIDKLDDAVAAKIRSCLNTTVEDWKLTDEMIAKLPQVASLSAADTEAVIDAVVDYFRRPWQPPLRETVVQVNEQSQYGAWTLLHGNAVNHFTAYINEHKVAEWPDLVSTLAGLREAGVPLKDSIEGEIGSKLCQSATKAATGDFPVREADGSVGSINWTYAYYELAQRGMITNDAGEEVLFTGFLGPQTPGLFEMTRKG